MKRKRALELQQEWGDRPCGHPSFAKEYDLGVRTGSFICTQCGAIVSLREKVEIMARRKAEDGADGRGGDDGADGAGGADGDPTSGPRRGAGRR
jgi:hypothetical protein